MSNVDGHAGPCSTWSMTVAAKRSPNWMSCGVSSEKSTKLGSTMLNAGSVPSAASGEELLDAADVAEMADHAQRRRHRP